jgi:hypothetical protein
MNILVHDTMGHAGAAAHTAHIGPVKNDGGGVQFFFRGKKGKYDILAVSQGRGYQ